MGLHTPACGCSFCVAIGRLHFFVTHPQRDFRLAGVAAQRVRLLYTDLVDLAEGFVGARELPGTPLLPDPLPPRGGPGVNPPVPGGEVSQKAADPPVVAATTKAAPPERPEVPVGPPPDQPPSLPRVGEEAQEESGKSPSKEAARGSKDKEEKPEEEKEERSKTPRKEKRDRKRASSSRARDRKRSRRTKSPEYLRERSRRRQRSRTRSRKARDREGGRGVKEEKASSEEPRRGFAEPIRTRSRGEGRRESAVRAPRSPPGPPPERPSWSGPIRAPRREAPAQDYWVGSWPKSKGVKRREKNRAFREANYPDRWRGYEEDYRERR